MGCAMKIPVILFFVCAVFVQATRGDKVVCEQLPINKCSFAVASSGKRCELYRNSTKGPVFELKCRASDVMAEKATGYIETDACVKACGVNRDVEGIKATAFVSSKLTTRACWEDCYENCPNIVDFFTHLSNKDDDLGLKIIHLCEHKSQ